MTTMTLAIMLRLGITSLILTLLSVTKNIHNSILLNNLVTFLVIALRIANPTVVTLFESIAKELLHAVSLDDNLLVGRNRIIRVRGR